MNHSHSSILAKINSIPKSPVCSDTKKTQAKLPSIEKEIDSDLLNDFLNTPKKGDPNLTPNK